MKTAVEVLIFIIALLMVGAGLSGLERDLKNARGCHCEHHAH